MDVGYLFFPRIMASIFLLSLHDCGSRVLDENQAGGNVRNSIAHTI